MLAQAGSAPPKPGRYSSGTGRTDLDRPGQTIDFRGLPRLARQLDRRPKPIVYPTS